MSSLATLLQLCDSAFPSGAFSHSFGLETAIAEDAVLDAASLEAWVRRYLLSGLASLDGSAIALVVRDGAVAETLDNVLGAALFCAEHRAAARRLALAMLDAYAAMAIDDPRLRRYTAAIAAGSAQGHPAVAFALAARAAHIIARDAIVGYASSVSATLASAAARAVPLGQRAVVHTLWRLRPTIEECAERALASRSVHDLHAEAFAAEIDAMRHRRLDGRLFAS